MNLGDVLLPRIGRDGDMVIRVNAETLPPVCRPSGGKIKHGIVVQKVVVPKHQIRQCLDRVVDLAIKLVLPEDP